LNWSRNVVFKRIATDSAGLSGVSRVCHNISEQTKTEKNTTQQLLSTDTQQRLERRQTNERKIQITTQQTDRQTDRDR